MPKRIQRRRTKGWRAPEGAIYVGRGSKWGNPFRLGKTQVRIPGVVNPTAEWELEGRLGKPNDDRVSFHHSDGRVTFHRVQLATPEQVVTIYREMMTGQREHTGGELRWWNPLEKISELHGKDLMCWCPLDQPCHADVLLEIANQELQ